MGDWDKGYRSEHMKRYLSILLSAFLALGITACGNAGSNGSGSQASSSSSATSTTSESGVTPSSGAGITEESSGSSNDTDASGDKVLVVYFSATGTTKSVAEKIASLTNGDLYEIKAAVEYTADDLNWNDSGSRSTKEQNDKSSRPEIGSDPVSLEGYGTIYIGYPIWWGEEPRIMDTFVEKYNFDGITMIPFCTSASSGIGRSGSNLADNAGSGNWLAGQRFAAGASEADISSWIAGLK